jgi:hypothetical protein
MTSNENNILPSFQDGKKYLDCILKNGDHDYESLDRQQISRNIIEVRVICLECGHESNVYQYIEDSELDL